MFRTQELEEVRVAREEACHGPVEVGRDREDHAVKLCSATIIRRVGDELDLGAGFPLREAKAPRPDPATANLGVLELGGRRVAEHVFRQDDDLIDEVVELLRRVLLEERDCGGRIANRHRIDVRDERRGGRAERGVLDEVHAIPNVARAHR